MMNDRSQLDAIDERAGDWLQRISAAPLEPVEQAEFDHWLANDPCHRQAFQELERVSLGLREMPVLSKYDVDYDAPAASGWLSALTNAWSRVNENSIRFAAFAGAAATLIAAVILLDLTGTGPAEPVSHETQLAEIRVLTLPDGSSVTLGARSKIDVAFSEAERRVVLAAGEAFFQVEKNANRPFFVVVDGTQIRVVGTQFDVHKGPETIRVAVLEGVVEVADTTGKSATSPDGMADKRVLTSGQQVLASAEGRLTDVTEVNITRAGAWRTGRLVYDDAPLIEVIADANRYYGKRLVLGTDALRDLRVSASFRTDQIEQMINSLTSSLELTVEYADSYTMLLQPAS